MIDDEKLAAAVLIVARAEGIPACMVLRPRHRRARRARWLVAYLLRVNSELTQDRIAQMLGCCRFVVRHGVARVEEARDFADIDDQISALEEGYRNALAA